MKSLRLLRFAIPAVLVMGLAACNENDVTGTGGALATLTVDTPDSATSGQVFNVQVSALAIGVTNVQNGLVQVTLPAPLQVTGVNASAGTTATFSNSAGGGAQVTWTLNTLDSNTQSNVEIATTGVLAPGSAPTMVTVQASLTADGISSGESVSQDAVELRPQ
jgi:hypothetical protein